MDGRRHVFSKEGCVKCRYANSAPSQAFSLLSICSDQPSILLINIHDSSKQRIPQADRHRFSLRVIRQRGLTQLTPDAALLVPAKWQLVMQCVVRVDPDGPCTQRIRDPDGSVEILGMQGRSKAISGGIAQADRVGFVLEFRNRTHGTEDFLLHYLHVFVHVGEDGGLNEVAFFAVAISADFELGTFLLAGLDMAEDCQ